MVQIASPSAGVRTGVVGAYVGAGDVAFVRRVRRTAGRVTLSGKNGMAILDTLARDGDLVGVDLDPAGYLKRESDQLALFAEDWTSRQRDLGLSIVRSQGRYVPRADQEALKSAMTEPVGADVVRVVSLHEAWLRPPDLEVLLRAVRVCDDDLAFVLASAMDPLAKLGAVDGLAELLVTAMAGGRRVEALRMDVSALGFVVLGGALGAIGLSTSGRHHGLPMRPSQANSYRARQSSPLVFVPELVCWQRGTALGSLAPVAGAGITDCNCAPCAGRSLLRFDRDASTQAPPAMREDAQAHDLATWSRLAREILDAEDPAVAWARTCSNAITTAAEIADHHKVALALPNSLVGWANLHR
jgi:hypothetical protein